MNIFEWIWGKHKEDAPQSEEKPIKRSVRNVFSTDLPKLRGMDKTQIESLAIPVRPDAMVKVSETGEKFAMDDAGSNAYDTKNAFILNNQRVDDLLMAWFSQQGFIGYQACAVMSQQWLIGKSCFMPAEDAARNGWDVTANDGGELDAETLSKINRIDERMRVHHNLVELTGFKRVFGIRVCMFVVESDDVDYYAKPYNPDGIKPGSYKGISQIDPMFMTPELGDDAVSSPDNIHFYEPTWWRIGSKRIHRSHLIVVRHREVPDILKPSYIYGGVPLPQMIYERVYASERTANEAPQLAMTKRMNIQKVDLDRAFADPVRFVNQIEEQAAYRDNYGVKVIGLDDEYMQHETSLADLDSVIMTQYQLVAAIAEIPATRLLGTSPKGFNATGEHELKAYAQMLRSIQANDMQPLLDRHYEILMRSEFDNQFKIDAVFRPLDEPTAKELAEINNIKANTYNTIMQTGAIDGEDIRDVLVKDETSGFSGMELGDSFEADFSDENL